MNNVEFLGQVFTPREIVTDMLSLRQRYGNILEPSCGDGAFLNCLESNAVGIEYDKGICPINALNMNFFDYSINNKFDTIIGNPPYVKYKNISKRTQKKLTNKIESNFFDERTNLYLFFIEKSIHHLKENGELIFIVPRDFLKASSAINLNKFIYESGTITDVKDLGDKIIFPGFSPNCLIFRFEKNNYSRKTVINNELYTFKEINGQLTFSKENYFINFADIFFVKVGAVSGLDEAFIHPNGNIDMVSSMTREHGEIKRVFYNINANELLPYKKQLLSRKIRNFNENNWYNWGRSYYESSLPRIYVNAKTRKNNPFFIHECKAFDGSLLAIFPKKPVSIDILNSMCIDLNLVNWQDLGFICDGRFIFSQRSLEQTLLPEIFRKYL